MDSDKLSAASIPPLAGSWRNDETSFAEVLPCPPFDPARPADPEVNDQSNLLQLLGLINFRILSGSTLYVEVNGTAYKILYGAYWRSVFNGAEHYTLKCEEIAQGMWMEGNLKPCEVDLSIGYTNDGWLVKGQSIRFMAYSEYT